MDPDGELVNLSESVCNEPEQITHSTAITTCYSQNWDPVTIPNDDPDFDDERYCGFDSASLDRYCGYDSYSTSNSANLDFQYQEDFTYYDNLDYLDLEGNEDGDDDYFCTDDGYDEPDFDYYDNDFNIDEDELEFDYPASKEAIESMLAMKYAHQVKNKEEEEEEELCAVCQFNFEQGEELRLMPCQHIFHSHCILPWLYRRRFCPLCRYEMPSMPNPELSSYHQPNPNPEPC